MYQQHRRTPQGVRGLKFHNSQPWIGALRRTPQGVRGLKFKNFLKPIDNG